MWVDASFFFIKDNNFIIRTENIDYIFSIYEDGQNCRLEKIKVIYK